MQRHAITQTATELPSHLPTLQTSQNIPDKKALLPGIEMDRRRFAAMDLAAIERPIVI